MRSFRCAYVNVQNLHRAVDPRSRNRWKDSFVQRYRSARSDDLHVQRTQKISPADTAIKLRQSRPRVHENFSGTGFDHADRRASPPLVTAFWGGMVELFQHIGREDFDRAVFLQATHVFKEGVDGKAQAPFRIGIMEGGIAPSHVFLQFLDVHYLLLPLMLYMEKTYEKW